MCVKAITRQSWGIFFETQCGLFLGNDNIPQLSWYSIVTVYILYHLRDILHAMTCPWNLG